MWAGHLFVVLRPESSFVDERIATMIIQKISIYEGLFNKSRWRRIEQLGFQRHSVGHYIGLGAHRWDIEIKTMFAKGAKRHHTG